MNVDLAIILDALPLAISISVGIFAFFANRRKDVDNKFDYVNERLMEGSRRMDRIDARVKANETSIEAMPGKDDVHALTLTLAEMGGDLKAQNATLHAMAESLKRTENIVTRHEDHLRGEKN